MGRNRLAEAFIEIAVRDSGVPRSLDRNRQAVQTHLQATSAAFLRNIKLREDAESTLAAKLQDMRVIERPPIDPRVAQQRQADLSAMRSHTAQRTQLMDREQQRQVEVAAVGRQTAASQKAADLEAMRMSRRKFEQQQAEDAARQQSLQQWIAQGRPRVDRTMVDPRAREAAQHAQAAAQARMNRFNQALLQASFGAQDFSVMYGPMGLQGALRASVNNWSQVAAIINPLQGAFVGLGLTLATVLYPYLLDTGNAADDTAKRMERLAASVQHLQNRAKLNVDLFRADIMPGEFGSSHEGLARQKSVDDEIAVTKKEIEEERRKLEDMKKLRQPEGIGSARVDVGNMGMDFFRGELANAVEAAGGKGINAWGPAIRDLMGKGAADIGDGLIATFNDKTGQVTVGRARSADELKKINEDVAASEARIAEKSNDVLVKERERVRIKERLKEVGNKELGEIKRGLAATDDLGRKLVQIEENRRAKRKKANEAMDATGTTTAGMKMLDDIDAQADKERRDAIKEDDKRKKQEANSQFAQTRRLVGEMRDDIAPAFAPVGRILDQMKERKREIADMENISVEKRQALMAMTDAAGRKQLDELAKKRVAPSFSGIAEMGNRVQLSLMSSGTEQDIRKTAQYAKMTVSQLEKINENLEPAGYKD